MNMTYRQLASIIKDMSGEQQDMSVSVYVHDTDEIYPVDVMEEYNTSDILDIGHPVLHVYDPVEPID
jgi:hypothetical protein